MHCTPYLDSIDSQQDIVKQLERMKNLHKIELIELRELSPLAVMYLGTLVVAAKQVLRGTSSRAEKFVTVKLGAAGVLSTYSLE